jgi:hypothetical protein
MTIVTVNVPRARNGVLHRKFVLESAQMPIRYTTTIAFVYARQNTRFCVLPTIHVILVERGEFLIITVIANAYQEKNPVEMGAMIHALMVKQETHQLVVVNVQQEKNLVEMGAMIHAPQITVEKVIVAVLLTHLLCLAQKFRQ